MEKINILGVEYTVEYRTSEEDESLKDRMGYCDVYDKKIVLKQYTEKEKYEFFITNNSQALYSETKRHEIIHAFFYESGREDWSSDEILVDFLAIQLPKIKDFL